MKSGRREDRPMTLGRRRLAAWIERSAFKTQGEAAEMLGVHAVVLSQWLSGDRVPGLENAVHLEALTGISVESWLQTDESWTESVAAATADKSSFSKR